MPVRIRLQRFGRKKLPFYRLVAADSRSPRDGKFIEMLGTFDPIARKDSVKEVRLNMERINYWLGVGAQPSQRVAWLLAKAGHLPEPPRRIRPHKSTPRAERGFCTAAVAPQCVPAPPPAARSAAGSWWAVLADADPALFGRLVALQGGACVPVPVVRE
eukprot:g6998.t1